MARIDLFDTPMDAIMKIADGNPGAVTAIAECMTRFESIDSDSAFGSFGFVLNLDSFEIYGSDVWILYKDLCKFSVLKTITIIRAIQLGVVPLHKIKSAITAGFIAQVEHEDILVKVIEILPNFVKNYKE